MTTIPGSNGLADTSKVFCCKFADTHNPNWNGFVAIGYVQLAHYSGIGPSGPQTITSGRSNLIGRQVTTALLDELQAECDLHPRLQYLSKIPRPRIGHSRHFCLTQEEAAELDVIETAIGAIV